MACLMSWVAQGGVSDELAETEEELAQIAHDAELGGLTASADDLDPEHKADSVTKETQRLLAMVSQATVVLVLVLVLALVLVI